MRCISCMFSQLPAQYSIRVIKACFSLGEFVRANREKSNLIGWRQTLTTSPANHIRFLLIRAKSPSGKRDFVKFQRAKGILLNYPDRAGGLTGNKPNLCNIGCLNFPQCLVDFVFILNSNLLGD